MKYYAFYLPQYHPINENNIWWGNNFTEWFNVTKAKPLFKGHHQPQLPKDIGFYDLRLDSVRQMQADMAAKYGIDGFIYYHYWFHGKRLLNEPLDMLMKNKTIKTSFAICWANENWTRAWDGLEREMLIKQEYSDADDANHFELISELFKDSRYIKIDQRNLFILYRPLKIPNFENFIKKFREFILKNNGVNPFILGVRDSSLDENMVGQMNRILDGVIDFQPNSEDFDDAMVSKSNAYNIIKKLLPDSVYQYFKIKVKTQKVVSYKNLVKAKEKYYLKHLNNIYPCVFPSWDNTARRNSPTIIQNEDGKLFSNWLKAASHYAKNKTDVVFINAWNEWAEGCHLEPDTKNGYKYLEAVRDVKSEITEVS